MAPGVIFMKSIYRREGASPDEIPYISNISLHIYRNIHGPLTNLRYVFFESVTNNATVNFLERMHYLRPSTSADALVTFDYGTNRYLEILGTRVGRVVGHMLLDAYPAGTHQIARIHLFKSHLRGSNLRFDIEPNVPRFAEAPAPRTSFMAATLSHLRNAAGALLSINIAPIGSYVGTDPTDYGAWGPGPPPPAGSFSIDASPYDASPYDASHTDDSRPNDSGTHIFTDTQSSFTGEPGTTQSIQADSSSTGDSSFFKSPPLGRHSDYDRGITNDAAVAATSLMTGDMPGALAAAVAITALKDDTNPPASAYTPAPGSSTTPGAASSTFAGAKSSSRPGRRGSTSKSSSLTRRRRSMSRHSPPHRRRGSASPPKQRGSSSDGNPPGSSPYHTATPSVGARSTPTAPSRPVLSRRTSRSPGRGYTGPTPRPAGSARLGAAAAIVGGISATAAASRRNLERNNTSSGKNTESSASATNRDSDAS